MLKNFLVTITLALTITACSAFSGDIGPRDRSMNLMLTYEPIQMGVEIAVNTTWVQARPVVKQRLQSASRIATTAVLNYHEATRGCERHPETKELILVVGLNCNPSTAGRLLQTALPLVVALGAELASINNSVGDN